jgi:ribulose-5-phosphate 4-epimerase/fuculose-1-phosphate aldolase
MGSTRVDGRREPSFETPVHLAVYRARPEVHAVVHTEPVHANVFGALGRQIEPVLVSLLAFNGGPVPVMPFRTSGSSAFGEEMLRVLGSGKAVVWGNHGLLTCGPTLRDAIQGAAAVERAAEVLLKAEALGTPRVLGSEELGDGAG